MKHSLLIMLILIFAHFGFSQQQCSDLFSITLEQMLYEERIDFLKDERVELIRTLPMPASWLSRLVSSTAREQHEKYQRQMQKMNSINEHLKVLMELKPEILSARILHNLTREAEARLITKLVSKKEYRRSLEAIHQIAMNSRTSYTEQDFLTSTMYYMIWGPDFSLLTTPFHHWVILNMTIGRNDESHLSSLMSQIDNTVQGYLNHRDYYQSPAVTYIEDAWARNYDPIFSDVQDTTSEEVQEAVQSALADGGMGFDENTWTSELSEDNESEYSNYDSSGSSYELSGSSDDSSGSGEE